ncbi:endoglucanase H [Candidatus Phycosocius bacilliformis]|uniref:Endoglucanase H n=1 Tax=Candidatus Phycosocius bacilliformis TaxID=1445552 RepID=A0A2P2E8J2_9PROT|nr:glycoside hydrolase family 5 protein [Candidatus Phycosocius bacilliformis]GBF57386.1 endoglucanase H [Candidatus Phycosocius bacilliformis]
MTDERLTKAMKPAAALKRRLRLALGLGTIGLGAGLGIAVAQGVWMMTGASTAQAAPAVVRAPLPIENCINVAGALEAPNEGDWGYRIRRRDLATIRAAGFDTIRVPIKFSAHALETAPYTIDPQFLARIDEVVAWALENDLTIILNLCHYTELFEDPDTHEPRLIALWAQIAKRYANASPKVMFELINEPQEAFSGPRVNRVQAEALAVIRKTNPTRTVIFAGDQWGNINGMDNLELPNDPYVAGTVHYYQPFEFTHQGAKWMDNPPPAGRLWPRRGEMAEHAHDMARIAEFRARIQAPVLLGEYGVGVEVPMSLRADWTRAMSRAFKEMNMPACYFNFTGGFDSYDRSVERWHAPILEALELNKK